MEKLLARALLSPLILPREHGLETRSVLAVVVLYAQRQNDSQAERERERECVCVCVRERQ